MSYNQPWPDLSWPWVTVIQIKYTCKCNCQGWRRRGLGDGARGAWSPCILTLRSVITDTNQRGWRSGWCTWGQSNTPHNRLLTQPPSFPPPTSLFLSNRESPLFPRLRLSPPSLPPPFPPLHNASFWFRLIHFATLKHVSSSPLRPSLLHSPSAAVSRPRHPTLPSAADINQPLCGKQREGRSERERGREGCKGRKEDGREASRQPVIRTNVDGLHIAGWEPDNGSAPCLKFI